MGDGKLQIDQRMDRIESALMILVREEPNPDLVNRIEQTLKGETPLVTQGQ